MSWSNDGWQRKNGVWSAPLTGGINPSSAPMDAVTGVTWQGGYGVSALNAAWRVAGKSLFTLASSGVIIKTIAGGYPDVKALASALNVSPTTGIGGALVSKWFDQSGNGNDLTQTTTANQPAIWLIKGKVFMAFDGLIYDYVHSFIDSSNGDKFFNMPSGMATNNRALSVFAAIQQNVSGNAFGFTNTYISSLFTTGVTTGAGNSGVNFSSNATDAKAPLHNTFAWPDFSALSSAIFPEVQPCVLGFVGATGATTFTQNEESSTGAALAAGSPSGGTIGSLPFFGSTGGFYGRMQSIMFATSALSADNQAIVRKSMYSTFGINSNPNISILIDGASIDDATGALIGGVQGYGCWEQLFDQLNGSVAATLRMGNTAVYGAKIADLTTNFAACQGTFFSPSSTKNILIGPTAAAGNTISGGKTGAQAYSDLLLYIAAAKTAGWTRIGVSVVGPGTENTNYNNLIIANAAAQGFTVIGQNNPFLQAFPVTDPILFNTSGPYADHPTVLGYSQLAAGYVVDIQAMLAA